MNVFDKWGDEGGTISGYHGGKIILLRPGSPPRAFYTWAWAQEYLEDFFDVPTPWRLWRAGWTQSGIGMWKKNGVAVLLVPTLTLAEMEKRVVVIDPKGLGLVQGDCQNTFTWTNPRGCVFHVRHDRSTPSVWYIYPSQQSVTPIFEGTTQALTLKSYLEKLQ